MKKKKPRSLSQRWAVLGYLFTLPWLVGFLAFTVYPLIYSLYLTGNAVKIGGNGILTTPIGFANFAHALSIDYLFLMDMVEAIKTFAIMVPLIIILSMMIGIMLAQKIRLKGLFRAIYFLPVIIMSGSLLSMLETNGVFKLVDLTDSSVLRWLQLEGFRAFLPVVLFFLEHIFRVLWFSGTQILIYLSGMQKIDPCIYEAASIDGCSGWQSFWKITLPSLRHFTLLNVFYTIVIIGTFSENPVLVRIRTMMLGNGDFEGYGYAATQAWIYFILMVLVLGICMLPLRERKPKGKAARVWKR